MGIVRGVIGGRISATAVRTIATVTATAVVLDLVVVRPIHLHFDAPGEEAKTLARKQGGEGIERSGNDVSFEKPSSSKNKQMRCFGVTGR